MPENQVNIPQVGISFKHPSLLKENEFSLLLNGSISSFSNNYFLVSSDQSNKLCSRLHGYMVLNSYVVPSLYLTFLFLVDPTTGKSQIGYIRDQYNHDTQNRTTNCENCNNPVIPDSPLEQTTQKESCKFYTFTDADCLNFNINYPIQSWIKVDDCNIRIYFTDNYNPPRYIDYNTTKLQNTELLQCPSLPSDELDCDKIKIFPSTCYPEISVVDVVSGGQNIAGTYQFAIAYSDVRGNKITDYYHVTNPVPLFSEQITVQTDYPVAKSIKLQITNLNTDFNYLNLVVLKTINNQTTPYLVDILEINSPSFTYLYTGIDKNIIQNLSIDDIIQKKPIYYAAKGIAESNGYLMLYDVKEPRILNLQPYMIDLPVYWQTVSLEEGDYKDSLIASDYVGYLGDEIYALGISFTRKDGPNTAVFHIAGRDSIPSDFDNMACIDENGNPTQCPSGTVTNKDVLIDNTCTSGIPAFRWQVYNTAKLLGDAIGYSEIPIEASVVKTCTSQQFQLQVVGGVNQYYTASGVYVGTDISALNLCDSCKTNLIDQYSNTPGITFESISYNTPNLVFGDQNSNINLITPSGVIQVPVYAEDQSVPRVPNYPYDDCPCADAYCDGHKSAIDTKQNTTCSFAVQAFISSTAQCAMDGGQFAPQFGSFLPNPSGVNTSCNPSFNDKNASWYSFTPSNTTPIAVSILTDNDPVFELFDSCPATTPLTNGTSTTGDIYQFSGVTPTQCAINRKYTLLHNLIPGRTYFLKVYSETGDIPPPYADFKKCYFRLCLTTPNVDHYVQTSVNNIVTLTCSFTVNYSTTLIPQNKCAVQNYQTGLMAYWESTELYPCNTELYGSYAGKPIRHHKFPDETVSPFFQYSSTLSPSLYSSKCKIYPKGIMISVKDIKKKLEQAYLDGKITQQELNSICGYRIWRSDRRGNESIVAKGLIRDVWKYKDNTFNSGDDILFSNFPYNDNRPNLYIQDRKIHTSNDVNPNYLIKHPYSDYKNNMFVFDAPNLLFNNPGLGTELKIESELSGYSQGTYQDVKNNTTYQYIGAGIISASIGFASVEAAFEALTVMASATLTMAITVFGSGTDLPLGLILAVIGENIVAPFRVMNYYGDWYDIISKFAPFRNYATYYSSVGNYSTDTPTPNVGNKRRTVSNAEYLKPGILNVPTQAGNMRFNNYNRESTTFIETSDFFPKTTLPDESRFVPTTSAQWDHPANLSKIASYYGSLKNNLQNQYGTLESISYIDTGFNGNIYWDHPEQDTTQLTIFGGDTYINRFALKTKVPFFLDDRVPTNSNTLTASENLDILLSEIPNIAYPVYFMDYPTGLDYSGGQLQIFGDVAVFNTTKADFHFVNYSSDGNSWADYGLGAAITGGLAGVAFGIVSLPIFIGIAISAVKNDLGNDVFLKGKYFHSCYGIPYFLCESNYNLDYRYGQNNTDKDFYPHVADIVSWTQQTFVPIYNDNHYYYNSDYSKANKENFTYVLNQDFRQTEEDCKVNHQDRVIYSLQDLDQNDRYDGNLIFLSNNYHDFPKSGGKIKIIKGIENNKVLVVQENQASVFNSYISSTNVEISQTTVQGSNQLFNGNIPAQYIKTDLGYGGSQVSSSVSSEFGHFWVDNKRGEIFQLTTSIKNIIKPEDAWFFKENLPFQILRDFPDADIDNNCKYFGMTMGYDARYKRIFFTKRDARLLSEFKSKVSYDGENFILKISPTESQIILPTDNKYFCNKSWTISYSPLTETFTSFHSFTPNYYISNQLYFQTGINFSTTQDQTEQGLWTHLITNKSFCVYYGHIKPFILEFATKTDLKNKKLNSIEYRAESRIYNNDTDYYVSNTKTYNKALIHNSQQTSGYLNITPRQKNNLFQATKFPSISPDGTNILIENIENVWRFNQGLYDISLKNGQSIMTNFCHTVYKDLNINSISYKPIFLKNYLSDDYFCIRLINDTDSTIQINHRFTITEQTNSPI